MPPFQFGLAVRLPDLSVRKIRCSVHLKVGRGLPAPMAVAIVEADPSSDQRDILAQMHISLADAVPRQNVVHLQNE